MHGDPLDDRVDRCPGNTIVRSIALLDTPMVTALLFNLQTGGGDVELAGRYALLTGGFVLAGGGRWSVDAYVIKQNGRRAANAS